MNYSIAKDLNNIARKNASAIKDKAHKNGQSINIEAVKIHEFAEVMVKETLDILYKTLDDSHDVQVSEGLRLAQQVIREHFGIE
jgi:hypothetical protein